MTDKRRPAFVTHSLRIGAYLAAFLWFALVWGSLKVLSTPDTGRYSHMRGWTILTIAILVMIATMDHWVKYLQIILGGGILSGLLAVAEGHLLNGHPFPRFTAAALTALFASCSLISRPLTRAKLTMFDRAALICFLAALISGTLRDRPTDGIIGLGIGFACLLAIRLRHRLRAQHNESQA